MTVTATLSLALSSAVTVPLTLTAGTAETGDYETLASSITVNAGSLRRIPLRAGVTNIRAAAIPARSICDLPSAGTHCCHRNAQSAGGTAQ